MMTDRDLVWLDKGENHAYIFQLKVVGSLNREENDMSLKVVEMLRKKIKFICWIELLRDNN